MDIGFVWLYQTKYHYNFTITSTYGAKPPTTFPSQQLPASVPGHSAAQQHRPRGVEGTLHLSAAPRGPRGGAAGAMHWLMGEHPKKKITLW